MYLLYDNNKYYFYQSGLDPSWAWLSPGTLLFNHCIKTAYERVAEEFDFLQGEEDYKSEWTQTKRTNVKVIVYNHTLNGQLLKHIDKCNNAVRTIVKRYLLPKKKRNLKHNYTYHRITIC